MVLWIFQTELKQCKNLKVFFCGTVPLFAHFISCYRGMLLTSVDFLMCLGWHINSIPAVHAKDDYKRLTISSCTYRFRSEKGNTHLVEYRRRSPSDDFAPVRPLVSPSFPTLPGTRFIRTFNRCALLCSLSLLLPPYYYFIYYLCAAAICVSPQSKLSTFTLFTDRMTTHIKFKLPHHSTTHTLTHTFALFDLAVGFPCLSTLVGVKCLSTIVGVNTLTGLQVPIQCRLVLLLRQ